MQIDLSAELLDSYLDVSEVVDVQFEIQGPVMTSTPAKDEKKKKPKNQARERGEEGEEEGKVGDKEGEEEEKRKTRGGIEREEKEEKRMTPKKKTREGGEGEEKKKKKLKKQTGEHICEICGKSYTTMHNLTEHGQLMKHDAGSGARYTCTICGKKYNHKDAFYGHTSKHHGLKPFEQMCASLSQVCVRYLAL
jgi:hypothetical protein